MANPFRVRVSGPLKSFAQGFAAELSQQGYRPKPVTDHLRLLAHLSRWLYCKGLDAADLTDSLLKEFLDARRLQGYVLWLSWKALAPLTVYLRGIGVTIHVRQPALNPAEALLARFRQHLLGTRGLTPASARGYVDIVRAFVASRLVDDELDWANLHAGDVHGFVFKASCGRSIGSAKLLTTALRSLLNYAHVEGLLSAALGNFVPAVAGSRLAGLPRSLEPAEYDACSPRVTAAPRQVDATSRC
ncbi:site-specific integrase [Variovorax rhizosphaerae]|uniref:Site-specific integrase n=1 Tax=Variovorax rhizosphaerae TaxID=1836200 RepID=A0ABU8X077_9BURK